MNNDKGNINIFSGIVYTILLAINIIVAACLIIATIAPYINPSRYLLPSLLGLGFKIIAIANIFMIIVWLFTFRKRYTLISLLAIVIAIGPIKTSCNIFAHHENHIKESNQLKITTYNTLRLGRRKAIDNNGVIAYIKQQNSDIVFLQEYEESNTSHYLQHSEIRAALPQYKYMQTQFRISDKTRNFGVAILSKYPLINKQNIEYESTYNGAFRCDAIVGSDTLRLICVHLESNQITGHELDQPVQNAINQNSNDFNASTKNIIDKLHKAYKLRSVQADLIAREISNSPYKTILCGDFNDVSVSYTYKTISKNMNDSFITAGPRGFGNTFKRKWLHVRIDYILYSKGLQAYNMHIDNDKSSDHYPAGCIIAW